MKKYVAIIVLLAFSSAYSLHRFTGPAEDRSGRWDGDKLFYGYVDDVNSVVAIEEVDSLSTFVAGTSGILTVTDDGDGTITLNVTNVSDSDFGEIVVSSGSWTVDDDVIDADNMANDDHGMVSWTSNSATVEDFALNANADAGDYDITSVDKLEGYDTAVYLDMGTDGTWYAVADTLWKVESSDVRLGVDSAAYLSVVTADGGSTTISQVSDGTDAIVIGDGGDTISVNSGDWDISTTGVATGFGNITSDGTIEGATITEGGEDVYNATETPGGELGGTWASPTIDDSLTVSGWTIDSLTVTTGITATDLIDSDDYAAGSIDHEHLASDVVTGAAAVGTFESGDTFLVYEAGVGLREADYDDLPGAGGGDSWGDAVDASIVPTGADNTYDIGSAAAEFKDGYFDGTLYTDALSIPEGALADATVIDADIKDDTFQEPALNCTNGPTDNYILSYNAAGTNFTWIESTGTDDQTLAEVLGEGADGGDIDITSLGKLEFFDAGLYLDADADGVMNLTSDGTLELHSSDWDISTTGTLTDTEWQGTAIADAYVPDDITIDLATTATHVTVTDNEVANEENEVPFVEDASAPGDVGLESDSGFTYNPSTGTLTAAEFSGGGASLTGVDAATGDSATDFFDAGEIADARISDTHSHAADSIDAITEIAAALKSGADGTLITGTAGTNTYTGVWDASGDLVDGYDPASKADVAGDTYSGTHDFGGADDVELPNGTNPTTDTQGQVAVDSDDHFIEVYTDESRVVPTVYMPPPKIIAYPADLQGDLDAWAIFPVEAEAFPHGITILDCGIKTDNSSSYSVNFEEWTSPSDGAPSTIETVATSTSYEAEDDGTLSDAAIAAGSIIYVDLPTTAGTTMLTVWFTYKINPGD